MDKIKSGHSTIDYGLRKIVYNATLTFSTNEKNTEKIWENIKIVYKKTTMEKKMFAETYV